MKNLLKKIVLFSLCALPFIGMSQNTLKRKTLKEISSGYHTIYLKIEKSKGGIGALLNLFGEVKANYESRDGDIIFATLTCTGQGFIPCRITNLAYNSAVSDPNSSTGINVNNGLSNNQSSSNLSITSGQRLSSSTSLSSSKTSINSNRLSSNSSTNSLINTATPLSTIDFANNPACIKAVNNIIEYSEQELVKGVLSGQKTNQVAVRNDNGVVIGYFAIKGNWSYNAADSSDGNLDITISKVANNPLQILY